MNWLARTARTAVRCAQPLVPCDCDGVTIVAYHLVGAGTKSPVDIPLISFRAQMAELREVACVYSLPDALAHLESGAHSSRPVVVVTFDDAFDNFRTCAWPVLEQFGIPCTLYVPVGFVRTHTTPHLGERGVWRPFRNVRCATLRRMLFSRSAPTAGVIRTFVSCAPLSCGRT